MIFTIYFNYSPSNLNGSIFFIFSNNIYLYRIDYWMILNKPRYTRRNQYSPSFQYFKTEFYTETLVECKAIGYGFYYNFSFWILQTFIDITTSPISMKITIYIAPEYPPMGYLDYQVYYTKTIKYHSLILSFASQFDLFNKLQ